MINGKRDLSGSQEAPLDYNRFIRKTYKVRSQTRQSRMEQLIASLVNRLTFYGVASRRGRRRRKEKRMKSKKKENNEYGSFNFVSLAFLLT